MRIVKTNLMKRRIAMQSPARTDTLNATMENASVTPISATVLTIAEMDRMSRLRDTRVRKSLPATVVNGSVLMRKNA